MIDQAARLRTLPRMQLSAGQTALEPWGRLSEQLGVHLFAKREDLGGIGLGGNKLRKLELLLGKAKEEGATWVVTTGGPQSNHARLTAAAAARCGMGCTLVLRGEWTGSMVGNLLVDRLLGARVRLLGEVSYDDADRAMQQEAQSLRESGHVPAIIPLGGATAEGTAAYVEAFREIADQMQERGRRPDVVIVAAGTGSTFAGLLLGARLFSPKTRVVGISVSWTRERLREEVGRLMSETEMLLGIAPPPAQEVCVESDYVGPGYARVSDAGREAMRLVATQEGVLLDSTYTGKAFAGLTGLIACGDIARGATVVFVHTGGTPELFARDPAALIAGEGIEQPMSDLRPDSKPGVHGSGDRPRG